MGNKGRDRAVSDIYVRRGILLVMILLGVILFLVLVFRLGKLMLVDHTYYETKAINTQTRSTSVTASRGSIYDRNMEVLAASRSVENIFLDPQELHSAGVDIDKLAKDLGEILDLEPQYIKEQAEKIKWRYQVIKRRQEKEVCDRVRDYLSENEIVGVHLEPDSLRYYPNREVASQLLGFTNTENVGSEGLESFYNRYLEGTAGAVITTRGNNKTQMLYSYEKYYEAQEGSSLVLTVDLTVQRALEKQMLDAIDRYDVLNGAFGIVMDAETGEILAMSTLGGYDPNSYLEIFDPEESAELEEMYQGASLLPEDSEEREEAFSGYNKAVAAARLKQWRNRCVSDGYEPGSTFKLITLSAALDSGAVSLTDSFHCGGKEKFEGRQQILNCWKSVGHGGQSTAQALQNSCNLAFAHMGLRLGGEKLYEYCQAFGLLEPTGVDLPGESGGVFHTEERLADNDKYGTSYLISTSFGQTVKPTPLQVVRAVAAVVNGGYLLEPYIVSQVLDENGYVLKKTERTVLRQVISEETSATMCELLESVVTEGTAGNAKVTGYRIGGKTGTAEKTDQLDENGNYTKDKIVSFVGVAPMENPRYIVLVALDTPNAATGQYISGGMMAAPTVAAVFEDILPYLGVQPEVAREEMYRVNMTMPDVTGMTEAEAAKVLSEVYLNYRIIGNGSKILSQIPAAGKAVPGYSEVLLYTQEAEPEAPVQVPSLIGLTAAEATELLSELGLYLQAKGTDSTARSVAATAQDIDPGTEVPRGTTITVLFADTAAMD